MEKGKSLIGRLELEMAVAVLICTLLSTFVWNKIQIMTACISVLMCTQDSAKFSFKSGVTRTIVTVAGACTAILISLLNSLIDIHILQILIVAVGVLIAIAICKLANTPAMSTRIGAISFILVTYTPGASTWSYGLYRILSTVVGAAVALVVVYAAGLIVKPKAETAAQKGH